MSSEKLPLDIDEVERIAKQIVSRRISSEVRNLLIESTDLKEMAGILVYEVAGFADVVTVPKKFMTSEKVERKYWTLKMEATTGKVLSFKM